MLKIVRTDANNPDFMELVTSLDSYLKITDGDEHAFYNQFNAIAVIKHVVVGYLNGVPVACGAFKAFDTTTVEIKRMFTKSVVRGHGIPSAILTALEIWAQESGYTSAILETGTRQVEAVSFYKKCGYHVIANYGQYKNMEHSVCYKKEIDEKAL